MSFNCQECKDFVSHGPATLLEGEAFCDKCSPTGVISHKIATQQVDRQGTRVFFARWRVVGFVATQKWWICERHNGAPVGGAATWAHRKVTGPFDNKVAAYAWLDAQVMRLLDIGGLDTSMQAPPETPSQPATAAPANDQG